MGFVAFKYRKSTTASTDALTVAMPSVNTSFTQLFTSAGSQTSYTSGTVNLPTGKAYVLFLYDHASSTQGSDPSISGLGLTWTKEYSVNAGDPGTRHSVFRGVGTPTSGTVTATLNHSTGVSAGIGILAINNANTTTPVVQVHRVENFPNDIVSSTMTAFSNSRNMGVALATCSEHRSSGQINFGGGWSNIASTHLAANGISDNYDISIVLGNGSINDNSFNVDYTVTNEWKWNLAVEIASI